MDFEKVQGFIKKQDVIDLALALGNIQSPPGGERAAGQFVYEWLCDEGILARKIGLLEDRFSVAGCLPGRGGGYSLMFNSHLDTSRSPLDNWTFEDPADPEYHTAWLEGDEIVGDGVVNDKGPMAAFLIAARAIKNAGVTPLGDILVTAVPGEISLEPVDEFQGVEFIGKDLGTRFMLNHGVAADYCLLAEGTGFALVWTEAGKAFFKITVYSDSPSYYTPYVPERGQTKDAPNAIVRSTVLIEALEKWAADHERKRTLESPGGTVVPKASINAIRSGHPARLTRTPQLCGVYMDVRLRPQEDPLAIREELRQVVRESGLRADVEMYLHRRGYEATGVDRLAEAIRRQHVEVFSKPPAKPSPAVSSMWRDSNVFVEMGIPTISYAPRSASHSVRRAFKQDDLYKAALVYARIALDVCSQEKVGG